MKILQRSGNQKGFTLLELLIAVSFLAMALLAVVGLQTTAIQSNSIANRLSAATSIAQQIMEDFAARPIDDPLLNSTNTNINYNFNVNTMTTPVFSITVPNAGTYSATYSTSVNNPTSGVTRLDIVVTGDAATGRQVALTTFVRTN
ncbi:MAG TPA: prepilin-type N-terminal cleavage/methylation domain-containing protein [Nitrospirota bacterium]|nr:prepilin-type N-terminal cleavage/methylation domain-containing protein [Nitrospirota bacterium]